MTDDISVTRMPGGWGVCVGNAVIWLSRRPNAFSEEAHLDAVAVSEILAARRRGEVTPNTTNAGVYAWRNR